MNRSIYGFVITCALAMLGSVAGAQTRGSASAMRIPTVHPSPSARVSPAFRQARVIQSSPGFSSFAGSTGFGSPNGVPGLGFDYPHLAAIGGGLHSGRTSSFGRVNHRGHVAIAPIFLGGYPYYLGDYDYGDSNVDASAYAQPQQQPQVIVIQQPVPVTPQAVVSDNDPAISAALSPPAPVREVGEFVLVRGDGRVLFASAFSVTGTQLHYITPEGIRRSLPLSDIDADATQQMNEARGTTVQIRN